MWTRWPVRIAVVLVVAAAVLAGALMGDREPESAVVKVGELLGHLTGEVSHGPAGASHTVTPVP